MPLILLANQTPYNPHTALGVFIKTPKGVSEFMLLFLFIHVNKNGGGMFQGKRSAYTTVYCSMQVEGHYTSSTVMQFFRTDITHM